MSTSPPPTYTIVATCPDRPGIVAAVSGFIAGQGGSIIEAAQHSDLEQGCFFMRYMIDAASLKLSEEELIQRFTPIADELAMSWRITHSDRRKRGVILVSRQDHCLVDLLYRWRSGDLNFDLVAVISNHDALRELVSWHGIPYHHIPIDPADKRPGFAATEALFQALGGDVMVLARYMQILPGEICARYPGQIINIHHSFLPSFIGAKPYHQAYERGVKLIGATCHYVTEDLDAGPIIDQDVIRVSHDHSAQDMVRRGRDVEKQVLARGLRLHLEDRVLIHGNKTVVLD